MGGRIRMGNTCKPMADSFQCMTKPTTIKKIIIIKKIKKNKNLLKTLQTQQGGDEYHYNNREKMKILKGDLAQHREPL